jgi:predicted Zn-dependent protease with MMP-like domain
MTDWTTASAPSLDDFASMAQAAFEALPGTFRVVAGEVIIRIDDFASEDILTEFGMEDPFELTGLYQGVDIGSRDSLGPAPEPSRIFLYRRPILDEWCERGDVSLSGLIAHVLIHEIGHHFGLTDDDIDAIEETTETNSLKLLSIADGGAGFSTGPNPLVRPRRSLQ